MGPDTDSVPRHCDDDDDDVSKLWIGQTIIVVILQLLQHDVDDTDFVHTPTGWSHKFG